MAEGLLPPAPLGAPVTAGFRTGLAGRKVKVHCARSAPLCSQTPRARGTFAEPPSDAHLAPVLLSTGVNPTGRKVKGHGIAVPSGKREGVSVSGCAAVAKTTPVHVERPATYHCRRNVGKES